MKKYVYLLSSLLMTATLNGMMVVAQRLDQRVIAAQRRTISFVPSKRYPGYLVLLNRDCTSKELNGALHTKIQNPGDPKNNIIIKRDNLTEKEEVFAGNPAYIGLPDSGCVWGNDCSIEKSSFFGSKNDYGFFPIALFREIDVAAWSKGSRPEKISNEETRNIVSLENPMLKQKYPHFFE